MLDFSFVEIEYGWLRMKVQADRKYIIWSCDECLSDPLPGMVRMYNALKEGKDAFWKIERGQKLSFKTTFKNEDKDIVWLTIHAEGRGDYLISDETKSAKFYENADREDFLGDKEIFVEEEIATDVLMLKFEIFFDLLLSNKFYPSQYPCYSWQDDDVYDRVDNEADEFVQKKYPHLSEEARDKLALEYIAKHCVLNETGKDIYEKYDNMLRSYVVPEDWK